MVDKHASSASSASRGNVLRRGKACIRCRRRKMKCDGARPICTPCIEANKVDDCEYTDNQGRTRTQMLEENIARLESRLQELEGNAASDQPLLLHDPYSTATPPILRHAGPSTSNVQPVPGQWWSGAELPAQISDTLALGFAIDPGRFREHASPSSPHPARPHSALLNGVYLWALRISNSIELRQHEDGFLQRAILALQDSPEQEPEHAARGRVQAVQAEILLSQYFFCLGHNVEGRYHANAAVALALSCSLHQISLRETSSVESGSSASFTSSVSLAPPRDANERAERIRVFWAVFDLDYCWSSALESPYSLSDDAARGTQIDTPWSEELRIGMDERTVRSFLSGHSVLDKDDSYSVFRSKVSALYGRATSLSGRSDLDISAEEEVQKLARITAEFAGGLPRLDELDAVGDDVRLTMAVTHSVAHASMIHLHCALESSAERRASIARLSHADEIVAILEFVSNISLRNEENMQRTVLDPILAVCGSMAGCVFIEELSRSNHGPKTHEARSQRQKLRSSTNLLTEVLHRCAGFANAYPIFSHHANIIEEELPDDLLKE